MCAHVRVGSRFIEAQEASWKSAKHAQQWRNTIKTYASPVLGKLLVQDVTLAHVLAVLEPIWRTRTETPPRLRNRLELVLDWATARGYRSGPNPVRWKGHLDKLLPAPAKVARKEHHLALPYVGAQAFMARACASKRASGPGR